MCKLTDHGRCCYDDKHLDIEQNALILLSKSAIQHADRGPSTDVHSGLLYIVVGIIFGVVGVSLDIIAGVIHGVIPDDIPGVILGKFCGIALSIVLGVSMKTNSN